MTSYEQMSDDELRVKIAEAMGWKPMTGFPNVWRDENGVFRASLDPIHDANDLREVRLWAWEKHRITLDVFCSGQGKVLVYAYRNISRVAVVACDHDGSRDGIIRAEGRATLIAVLKAIDAAQPQERAL